MSDKQNLFAYILDQLRNRAQLAFSAATYFYACFLNLCLSKKSKATNPYLEKLSLFRLGNKKIRRELDLEYILTTLRTVGILTKLVLGKN